MKCLFFSLALMGSLAMTVQAQEQTRGAGFNAPQVSGTSGVYNPVEGEIVFDGPGSAFYGYDGTGWINLGAAATPAGPSTAGIVTTGTQTLGGDKTFNGSLTPAGGIVGGTSLASLGFVGEYLASEDTTFQSDAASGYYYTGKTVQLTAGVWMIWGQVQAYRNGASGGNNIRGAFISTNNSNANTGNIASVTSATSGSATIDDNSNVIAPRVIVVASTTDYYLKAYNGGFASGTLHNAGIFALRIK